MRDFNQVLEAILSPNVELTHIEKNKRNRLEKALRAARRRTASMSGMGERYDSALAHEKSLLAKVGEYRPLTKYEVMVARHPYRQYHESLSRIDALVESAETRLLASILQKLDAMPALMPYNTYWTGSYAVSKRFGLTPDEEQALVGSRAWKKVENGWQIDRGILLQSSKRPDVPSRRSELVSPSRVREEVDMFFEEEEKKEKPTCVACGDTGKSSTGRPCEPCRLRKLNKKGLKNLS